MRLGIARHLGDLRHHMRRRRPVGIAHAEVDNILPPRPRRSLHRVHLGEYIRRQAADAAEIVGHSSPLAPPGKQAALLTIGSPTLRSGPHSGTYPAKRPQPVGAPSPPLRPSTQATREENFIILN